MILYWKNYGDPGEFSKSDHCCLDGEWEEIASNDNWQDDANAMALASSGYQPTDPKEAALLVSLLPGAYTAIVQGVGGTTGISIVRVADGMLAAGWQNWDMLGLMQQIQAQPRAATYIAAGEDT